MPTYFITAIDTDAGKTFATGLLAKAFMNKGLSVITMKIAQTGCVGLSDDIVQHRKLMGIDLMSFDHEGITCPYVFPTPASPHLAAEIKGVVIDTSVIISNIRILEKQFDVVLIEGVGGLMVPLNHSEMVIDFVLQHQLSIIIITSPKLGSLNHTFLTLEVCQSHSIKLHGIIYNHFPLVDERITNDSRLMIQTYSRQLYPDVKWGELPVVHLSNNSGIFDLLDELIC
jgi:dethiobiotin synthetase